MIIKTYKNKVVVFLVILCVAFINSFAIGTHTATWADASDYNAYAKNIISKGLYSMDGIHFSSYREPGYPLMLTAVYGLLGVESYASFLAIKIIQALMLALCGFMTFLIFNNLYGQSRLGITAGILAAAIPYYGFYTGEFLTELLFTFLLIMAFYLTIKLLFSKNSPLVIYLVLGLVLGYASITRAQLFPFPFLLAGVGLFLNKKYKILDRQKILAGGLVFLIITGSWMLYVYSQSGRFAITSGREKQVIYFRAVRSELSYREQVLYLVAWLNRSATGGKSSPLLDKYDFKGLITEYGALAIDDNKADEIEEKNIKTIATHLDKYLFGNLIEGVKLTFIEHTYVPGYNKYLRASFYVVLYSFFIVGIYCFIFLKKKDFKYIFWTAAVFLGYNIFMISLIDAVPRYNTPYLYFYLIIGVAGCGYMLSSKNRSFKFFPPNPNNLEQALKILQNKKVALMIVAYDAENHIHETLRRIPGEIAHGLAEIYLLDDCSSDNTLSRSIESARILGLKNFNAYRTPVNQGYGGNQKIGYAYAIKHNYDYVVMLHGDGQYPPEFIPDIISAFEDKDTYAVFASRMLTRYQALKGGMPVYKWFGNQFLTFIENKLMGSQLSEFHTGYRAYCVKTLASLPFLKNSNNFHFDTDIIIQLMAAGKKISEIPIPTYYGDEECHVNGFKYAWNCIKSVIRFRLHKIGLFYQSNFDVNVNANPYNFKNNKNTLHHYVANNLPWNEKDVVLELGANDGQMSRIISAKTKSLTAVDINQLNLSDLKNAEAIALDLNSDFDKILGYKNFDKIVVLDVIEHLYDQEESMHRISRLLKTDGILYASTGNIAYFIMRATLMLGWFNYGVRGILDKTHRRLFTISSFRRLLKNNGFKIEKIIGFGPPITDNVGANSILNFVDWLSGWLAHIRPSLFSFNFLVIASKKSDFDEIYSNTIIK